MTEHESQSFAIVRTANGRTSCWPTDREIPAGWSTTGFTGTRQQCLEKIADLDPQNSGEERKRPLAFSLMFFGDSEADRTGNKYRMLFEAVKFADQNNFAGVWIPERHFTAFGCLYPSPPVLLAALARETSQLRLRAGSVVLPLNDPVRIAEQFSMVDNLSNGRVEVAFASGWHPDDFALCPEAYEDRVQLMDEGIETVQSLWSGQAIQRLNGAKQEINVRTYPTPLQPELPIWLTAAGNPATFRRAGELGCGVLTHLFNQDVADLKEKIELYRSTLLQHGHDENRSRVAVTLHTFVADTIEAVRQLAGTSYRRYLRANLRLLKQLAFSQGQAMDLDSLSEPELDEMLHWVQEKYIGGRSLMGTVESCQATCQELSSIGVDEVACLLDFGPDPDDVLSHLTHLGRLAASQLAS